MIRRSELFDDSFGALGSATLTADEEYGALDSDSLFDEEEYGALDSDSLLDEEEYGAWYGEDDDEDDDDEYDEYAAWYGAEDGVDADLASLEAEIDQELFGAWYGAAPLAQRVEESGVSQRSVTLVEDAVGNAVVLLPNALEESGSGAGVIDDIVEAAYSMGSPGDAKEIAAYIVGHPNFANWNAMTEPRRIEIVRDAVASAAVPGIEMTAPGKLIDSFEQYYEGGFFSAVKSGTIAAAKAAWALASSDVPRAWAAMIGDIPVTGKLAEEIQDAIGQPNYDDIVNPYAVGIAIGGLVFPNIYKDIADSITSRAQSAIEEAQAASMQVTELAPIGPVPSVTPTPEAIPVQGGTLPAPPTILAVGYAVLTGGSLLGVF